MICLSIEIFMSKLDYCFESYKSPNVHTTKKGICDEHVRQHFHIKNSVLIIYLLEDEQELSLGCLICLQRIYNFLLLHAILSTVLDYIGFIFHFYIIFGTNLLTGGPVQIAIFFAYFSVSKKRNIKRSPNGMKPSRGSFL